MRASSADFGATRSPSAPIDRGIGALDRAAAAGVESFVVPFSAYADRTAWNRALEAALAERRPDLVVLAGFMRLLDAQLVDRFPMINTHPALLPSFPGVGIRASAERRWHTGSN